MTQPPVTVTYSLEEVLGQVIQKLDRVDDKLETFRKDVDDKFETLRKDVDDKFETLRKDVDDKFDITQDKLGSLQKELVDLKIGQARLESELKGDVKALESELKGDIKTLDTKVEGIGKRLDTQEFINRSVVVGFVLALVAGGVKLFFPGFPGQ
ncbi:MAG: Bdr protein [Cyanothece sp. SIO2G6]|nr:Bdr protein [Cyanothece sp. SIO2G6]